MNSARRDKVLSIKLSQAEIEMIQRRAEQEERNESDVARRILLAFFNNKLQGDVSAPARAAA